MYPRIRSRTTMRECLRSGQPRVPFAYHIRDIVYLERVDAVRQLTPAPVPGTNLSRRLAQDTRASARKAPEIHGGEDASLLSALDSSALSIQRSLSPGKTPAFVGHVDDSIQ